MISLFGNLMLPCFVSCISKGVCVDDSNEHDGNFNCECARGFYGTVCGQRKSVICNIKKKFICAYDVIYYYCHRIF